MGAPLLPSSSGLSSTLPRPLPSSLAAPPRSSSSSLATEAPRRRPDPRAARRCPAPGSADRARAVSLAAGHGGSWRGHGGSWRGHGDGGPSSLPFPPSSLPLPPARAHGGRVERRRGPCSVASRAGHARRASTLPARAEQRAAPPLPGSLPLPTSSWPARWHRRRGGGAEDGGVKEAAAGLPLLQPAVRAARGHARRRPPSREEGRRPRQEVAPPDPRRGGRSAGSRGILSAPPSPLPSANAIRASRSLEEPSRRGAGAGTASSAAGGRG